MFKKTAVCAAIALTLLASLLRADDVAVDVHHEFVTRSNFSVQVPFGILHEKDGWTTDWMIGASFSFLRTGGWRWLVPGLAFGSTGDKTAGLITLTPILRRLGSFGDIGEEYEVNIGASYVWDLTNHDHKIAAVVTIGFKFPFSKHD